MTRTRARRLCTQIILSLLAAACGVALLQLWAHREPSFFPDYPQAALTPVLAQPTLSEKDYNLLFAQTGLTKIAVDALWENGRDIILDRQASFFVPRKTVCTMLFPPFIREDRMADPDTGETLYGPLPTSLKDGDLLLTLDTHAFGWRHGHAGIVVDADNGIVLEAVGVGTTAIFRPLEHWREYRMYLVYRPTDRALGPQAAAYASEYLADCPYGLFSGLWGEKFPDLEETEFAAQCSYLVWYAYMVQGADLDSDGGRLVTVSDLARSPLLELVELYGTDPSKWS